MPDDSPIELDPARQHARACGLALLEVSRSYETLTLPAEETGKAAILALIGRARRLLLAAYLLADAGLDLEAGSSRRALVEYFLMVRWLLTDQDTNLMRWQPDDARRRLLADDAVRSGGDGGMTEEMRRDTERLVADLRDAFKTRGIHKPRVPNIETLAVELPFIYVVYRFESQISTHPSMWAAEQLLARNRDGTWQLHAGPTGRIEQAQVETYGVCAYSLLELLSMLDERLPEPMIETGRLDSIRAQLENPTG